MPIQVIEPRRLYLQIADQIRSLITAGEFPPGNRLPAERELAKRFRCLPTLHAGSADCFGGRRLRRCAARLGNHGHDTQKARRRTISGDEGPLEVLRVRSLIEGAIAAEVAPSMEQQRHSSWKRFFLRWKLRRRLRPAGR